MAKFTIPVDLKNPAQIFACLGFVEAAEILCGLTESRFKWEEKNEFELSIPGDQNPFALILGYLANAHVKSVIPDIWDTNYYSTDKYKPNQTFCDEKPNSTSLPIVLEVDGHKNIYLSHWADGSSRDEFKLYAGNRDAAGIASAMINGVSDKSGNRVTKGIAQLWSDDHVQLLSDPFIVTPLGGSFNFDPRGGWTSIDLGYSPNDHKHKVASSPVVEILAAMGLENTRPYKIDNRVYQYSVWGDPLPVSLSRAVLGATFASLNTRTFRFDLEMSGKNKIVTYAQEESRHD